MGTDSLACKRMGWRDGNFRSRGYLPHLTASVVTQFITCRLYDSLPQKLLRQLDAEFAADTTDAASVRRALRINEFIDAGFGECYLGRAEIARIVEDALLYFDNRRYQLRSWVIMPNHLHMLITLQGEWPLPAIMKSIKNYTARKANPILQREGQFWAPEYYERYIRDEKHFWKVVEYIENNPVKAGLCVSRDLWRFSSAHPTHAEFRERLKCDRMG